MPDHYIQTALPTLASATESFHLGPFASNILSWRLRYIHTGSHITSPTKARSGAQVIQVSLTDTG